jgi:hypothetical protein
MNPVSNWLALRDAKARAAETQRLVNHPVAQAWRENSARLIQQREQERQPDERQAAAEEPGPEVEEPEPVAEL